jgi:phage repressor protein C with HTH and peptisase S24 domain
LTRYLNGSRTGMTNSTLVRLAQALEIPVSYFFGESPLPSEEKESVLKPVEVPDINAIYSNVSKEEINQDDFIAVPLHETKAAATPAVIDVANGVTEGYVLIPGEIAKKYSRIEAFRVIGDSMKPELLDGDIVAVAVYDMPPDMFSLNKACIYFCQIDDGENIGYTLKKAEIYKNRFLNLIPVNQEYATMTLDLYDEKSYSPVIGRVVWSSRRY